MRFRNWKLEIRNWRSQADQGVVALLTSIIIGLLLIAITTSGIALMSSELRQATDFDSSIKAYYAAESGVEDAVAEIRRYLNAHPGDYSGIAKNSCSGSYGTENPDLSGTAGGVSNQVAYTCQIVSTSQNQLTGGLKIEEPTQVDLAGVSGYDRLQLQWNQGGTADPQTWTAIDPAFPTDAPWPYPAVMEVTVINYGSDASNAGSKTFVVKPVSSGGSSSVDISANPPPKPALVNCNPPSGTGYSCSITLTGFNSGAQSYFVRLSARYNGTHYQLQALRSNGTQVAIPNAQLLIDVTGKASDVFRRIQLKAPLAQQAPGFVLLADDAICKVMTVSGTTNLVTSPSETGCN